ncbi:hypothetical protein [Aestuariivita sp.]|jgi:hypothetical protein|uniref:hypothetical protein n=1 Tax=Aestuariivita sp. TaxID=1872407 RepID=UPI00216B8B18|nr:hypothetical protein [Aestuariivita sp.]MCE8007693.1 hypothetical protein [Aestuariivita sp.]
MIKAAPTDGVAAPITMVGTIPPPRKGADRDRADIRQNDHQDRLGIIAPMAAIAAANAVGTSTGLTGTTVPFIPLQSARSP